MCLHPEAAGVCCVERKLSWLVCFELFFEVVAVQVELERLIGGYTKVHMIALIDANLIGADGTSSLDRKVEGLVP